MARYEARSSLSVFWVPYSDPQFKPRPITNLLTNVLIVSVKYTMLPHTILKQAGFQRRDSMSQVLIELSLPSADTVIYNSRVLFHKQYTTCKNKYCCLVC